MVYFFYYCLQNLFMKQKLIILFLLGTIFTNISAQNSLDRITFGIKGGFNISTIKETQFGYISNEYNPIISKVGGFYVSIPIYKRLSIQSELLYSEMGTKSKYSTSSYNPPYYTGALFGFAYGDKLNLAYLSIPVMVKYTIPKTALSLMAGPQIGYLLSAKLNYYGPKDYKSSMSGTEVAGVIGAEYDFPFRFNISARYQTGFTNIANDNVYDVKNELLSFTIGYVFKKGK